MTEWYPWVVFVHVAAAFLFVMGHGASMWTSDQIRRERDATRIRALLEVSSRSLGMVYVGLVALLVAGIIAGIMGGHFARGWIWAAIGVLVVIIVLMYGLASRYYGRVRGGGRAARISDPERRTGSNARLSGGACRARRHAPPRRDRAHRGHRPARAALADDVQAVLRLATLSRRRRASALGRSGGGPSVRALQAAPGPGGSRRPPGTPRWR
jgi:hypothetical protein